VTMTPSRAVLLFKTEEGQTTHKLRREALPWWIFGVAGGLLTVWLGPEFSARSRGLSMKAPAGAPAWAAWARTAGFFIPGGLAGGAIGLVDDRLREPRAGLVLPEVQPRLRPDVGGLCARRGRIAARERAGVGGLRRFAGADLLGVSAGADRFIPQQDQGRLIANIQLPDSSSLERTKAVVAKIVKIAHHTPGIAHTVAYAGMSFLLQANSSNFASMFIVLDPFDKRQKPELRDTAIMNNLSKAWAENVKEAQATVLGASAIPGLGVAGGFKFVIEDRGDLGLATLQKQTDGLIDKLKKVPGLRPGDDAVPLQDAGVVPGHRPGEGRVAGRVAGRREPDLDIFMGSRYVNSSTISADTGRSRCRPRELSQ